MAVPLNTCTTIEQRGVVRFIVGKNMEAKYIHKVMLPIRASNAAHMGSISLWISFVQHMLAHKKRTTPRCSIGVHVCRGTAIF
jgi:hypothetical protein